ncbi:crotonyl-CoA carboxylase/reductase [Nonomuraea sp. NPDC050680]|uniref:crotonyl-CoA carboxylase/reductase n=1 Tax=Nonomuraea sp. NPDC050680 TaxID=3154630 RepID=UPI0033DCB471
MDPMAEALLGGAAPGDLAKIALPKEYPASYLRVEDTEMFAGMEDKDVRKSLRVGLVPMPELAPDEVVVAVMASSINYNTVWSATFEPLPTFGFLKRFGRTGSFAARHDQPYHVLGSDGAGVIVAVGAGVRRWQVGDHVVISPIQADDQEAATHDDGMLGAEQRVWGFETNFGGLAHYTLARASQLAPKPAHLTWEEAACVTLCAGTVYRMLVSPRGARMKQGDIVLIWGAAGGLGAYAVQMVKNGGGIPVGVVGSDSKAEILRSLGCDVIINRNEIGMTDDIDSTPEQAIALGKRLGAAIRAAVGEDPHIVMDYVGRATFATSVFVVRRGGAVVTCGSSTGFQHHYDNRYLWMHLKRIIGSHAANLQEVRECVRLFDLGMVMPTLSTVYPLDEVAEATRLVQTNGHIGKVGVLCMAPESGLGVTDPARRAEIGEQRLNPLRGLADAAPAALA